MVYLVVAAVGLAVGLVLGTLWSRAPAWWRGFQAGRRYQVRYPRLRSPVRTIGGVERRR